MVELSAAGKRKLEREEAAAKREAEKKARCACLCCRRRRLAAWGLAVYVAECVALCA